MCSLSTSSRNREPAQATGNASVEQSVPASRETNRDSTVAESMVALTDRQRIIAALGLTNCPEGPDYKLMGLVQKLPTQYHAAFDSYMKVLNSAFSSGQKPFSGNFVEPYRALIVLLDKLLPEQQRYIGAEASLKSIAHAQRPNGDFEWRLTFSETGSTLQQEQIGVVAPVWHERFIASSPVTRWFKDHAVSPSRALYELVCRENGATPTPEERA